jgi:integrase
VACDEAGRPYHPDTLSKRWSKLVRAAGVRHINLHSARHTCGTTLHLRGVPLSVVAAWLGHADASVTARIYAHSQPDALKAASVTLGGVVTSTVTSMGTAAETK